MLSQVECYGRPASRLAFQGRRGLPRASPTAMPDVDIRLRTSETHPETEVQTMDSKVQKMLLYAIKSTLFPSRGEGI